jgi:hypothetical protein
MEESNCQLESHSQAALEQWLQVAWLIEDWRLMRVGPATAREGKAAMKLLTDD